MKLAYLQPLANIGLFKRNHLAVISFSLFNNRVIYLDFLFNGSTFQRLKVSMPIILASTHFACILEFKVSSLMTFIIIHQSFHFKIANLIFKYFICFCIWGFLSSLLLPSQFNILAMANADLFFEIITNSSS